MLVMQGGRLLLDNKDNPPLVLSCCGESSMEDTDKAGPQYEAAEATPGGRDEKDTTPASLLDAEV